MPITQEQKSKMDAQERKVLADLTRAEAWAENMEMGREVADVAKYIPFLTVTVLAAEALLLSDEQKQQLAAVKLGRETYNRWTQVHRPWAEAGIRSTDGKPYSVEQWLEEGNANGKSLASALQYLWEDTPIAVSTAAVKQTAADVQHGAEVVAEAVKDAGEAALKTVTNPWPWWVKAGIGSVAVTALGVGAGYAVRSFRSLAP